jgi:hypothetical protein
MYVAMEQFYHLELAKVRYTVFCVVVEQFYLRNSSIIEFCGVLHIYR